MTIIRLSQEAGGLSISVEGAEASSTTIVLGGAQAGPLAIAGPAASAGAVPPARPFRGWLLGGLCFLLAAGLVTFVLGRHSSASGANAASSVAGATPARQAPVPTYPGQGPDQMPSALASAFSQPPVVVPPPGAGGGQADGAPAAPAPAPGSLFGLQP